MVDEQEAEKVNAEANSVTESPPVEEKAPEVQETAKPEQTETPAETPKTDGEEKFSGASKRIQKLVSEKKSLEAEKESLAEQVRKLTEGYQPSKEATMPQSQIQPGEEISVEDYNKKVYQTADAIVNIRLNQQKVVDNINKEANEVMKAYPELDPDNKEGYDRDLSDSIAEATLAYVKSNPTGSVKTFVTKLMKPYKKSLEQKVGQDTEKVVKQVSETALRPTQVKPTEKKLDEMTPEEIEKKVGVVY